MADQGEQMSLTFSKNTIENIIIYRESAEKESIGDDGFNVKFTPTQKQAIKGIIKEHNMSASTFLREAMDFYIDMFPYRKKIKKHHRFLRSVLERIA